MVDGRWYMVYQHTDPTNQHGFRTPPVLGPGTRTSDPLVSVVGPLLQDVRAVDVQGAQLAGAGECGPVAYTNKKGRPLNCQYHQP